MPIRRRLTTAAACTVLLIGAAAGATGATVAPAHLPVAHAQNQDGRGTLVHTERLYTLKTREAVTAELTRSGFDASQARHGVDAYRLTYRTIDPQGQPTTASGLLVLPRGRENRLRAVSFAHGTSSQRGDAPSVQRGTFLTGPPVAYASAGFAAVAPDYLGLGTGPGPHPWMHVPSETTASLDLLRAARAFHPLDRKVLVTGFSQGASAALGLGRALQVGDDRYFRLGALAPISGAYDFGGAELPALLAAELDRKSSVIYAAYTLVAFNRVHRVYDDPREVFEDPTVEALFDGEHTGADLYRGTPDSLEELLTSYGLDLLAHPRGGLADALRETDSVCRDWTPRVPVRLYMASGDEQATTANTAHCAESMRSMGVEPKVVDLGAVDYTESRHLGSNVKGTEEVLRWFRQLT
ncbi:alpha/beta fold hydrolase [Streptomyces sp. ITFR-6]|uniref:alpha/beta fold hydrolase n=1 Tax=Streptomyces sp. ITFR-6 TaxID=3075197 RepID=UPI00288B3223|nr:alpha/beta fold hydrolase [Streptomyces sp. ITFR-6]WNI32121.1 alpha/beta fold hydrolase [Streptomyces sp. ITFR-6]